MNGHLLSSDKSVDDDPSYVLVTFEFDSKGDITLGSFVEVYLLSSSIENVISLSRVVLAEEQGLFFVYPQLDEGGYKRQEVTPGADNGKSIQMPSGVRADDRIATQGVYQVKLASVGNTIPAYSHGH